MERLADYIDRKRDAVKSTLRAFLEEKEREFASVNEIGGDLCRRLLEFSLGGKMIRGVLVFLGYEIFAPRIDETEENFLVRRAAASMEILQSGLLIHDDIMDRDSSRRGRDTFHVQYGKYLKALSNNVDPADVSHLANSLAICAGDVAFFLSFELLTGDGSWIEGDGRKGLLKRVVKVLFHYSRELSLVGIGQMEDVSLGFSDKELGIDRVLNLYRYKTSRYTFSLPLIMGAIIAGVDGSIVSVLNGIGENLGILFQIRDDELGLFGDELTLGKPVGSDMREGKKNLIYVLLKEFIEVGKIRGEDANRIYSLWGTQGITEEDVLFVREIVKGKGVLERLNEIVNAYSEKVFDGIETLRGMGEVSSDKVDILEGFVNFVLKREK